jgi:hypothetical protein
VHRHERPVESLIIFGRPVNFRGIHRDDQPQVGDGGQARQLGCGQMLVLAGMAGLATAIGVAARA